MKKIIRQTLAAYGSATPYHPGKWRIVESLVGAFGLTKADPIQEVTRQGVRWRLNSEGLVERSVYYLGVYEIHETRWLKQQVEPGWVVFDVGSNFGYYANLLSHWAGAEAKVYAFEPSSRMFEALCTNKRLNDFKQLHPQHAAVADAPGILKLELPPKGNQGLGRLRDAGEEQDNREYEEVQTVTVSGFADEQGLERLDFIKIDVEGAEMRVLTGAEDAIRRFRPKMMIEINPPSLEDFGTSAAALLARIHDLGYTTHCTKSGTLVELTEAGQIGDYVNAICLPEKKA